MELRVGACALILLCAVAVRHASAEDGSICALLEDDRKRLDCYDLLFKKPQAEKPKPAEPAKTKTATGTGKWQLDSQLSKLDDSTNLFVSVAAIEPYDDGYESEYAGLTIACREGKTNLWVDFQTSMFGNAVIYRIDKTPAAKLKVELSSNSEALGLWTPEEAIPFAKKLLAADRLLIRAQPVGESAADFEFPVAGLAEAIKPLRKACRW
jgi:type VI secretion system protein VasI